VQTTAEALALPAAWLADVLDQVTLPIAWRQLDSGALWRFEDRALPWTFAPRAPRWEAAHRANSWTFREPRVGAF
jgi:hypothetical protein